MTTPSLIQSTQRRLLAALAVCVGLVGFASAQTTVQLTGGDAGQGLTLDASHVVLAWDIQGSGGTVQGVNFTGQPKANYFGGAFDFQGTATTADDYALSGLIGNGGWDGGGSAPLTFTFTGLAANASYRFDLIQSVLGYQTREQAIVVNGSFVTLVNLESYKAYNTTFLTTADSNGEISLLMVRSGGYGGFGTQDGAVLGALVLTAVPEPATYAVLFGLVALGLVAWRRQSRG